MNSRQILLNNLVRVQRDFNILAEKHGCNDGRTRAVYAGRERILNQLLPTAFGKQHWKDLAETYRDLMEKSIRAGNNNEAHYWRNKMEAAIKQSFSES